MRLKEKKLLQKFAATLKKFNAQGAKKVEYGIYNKTEATMSSGWGWHVKICIKFQVKSQ